MYIGDKLTSISYTLNSWFLHLIQWFFVKQPPRKKTFLTASITSDTQKVSVGV